MTANYNNLVFRALESEGYMVENVEHFNSFTGRKSDLYGIIDILAVGPAGTKAVQVTSRGNMSPRRRKINESPALPMMLMAGWLVELWGYDQPRGPRTRWRVQIEGFNQPTTNQGDNR